MKKYTLLLLIFTALQLFGQQNDPANWEYYHSMGEVTAHAEQDDKLWLGTKRGVVIVNKNTLEKEILTPYNSNFPAENIEAIDFDAEGAAFIGTYDYILGRYKDGEWTDIELPVDSVGLQWASTPLLYDLVVASDSSLWVATNNGLWRQKDNVWTNFNHESPGFPFEFNSDVWGVEEDSEGNIIFCSHRLGKFDGENLSTLDGVHSYSAPTYCDMTRRGDKILVSNRTFYFAEVVGSQVNYTSVGNVDFPSDKDWSVTYDLAGNIVITFWDGERYLFDNEAFTLFENNLTDALNTPINQFFYDNESREWAVRKSDLFRLENEAVNEIFMSEVPFNERGFKHFAETTDGRVYLFDPYGEFLSYRADEGWIHHEFPSVGVDFDAYDLLLDSEDNFWVPTNKGLLFHDDNGWTLMNSSNSDFPLDLVYRVAVSSSGHIYAVGSEAEIAHYFNGNWELLTPDNSILEPGFITAIATNDAGHLWTSYNGVIYFFDGMDWVLHDETNFNDLTGFGKILPLANDNVWMFDQGGLYHFDGIDWIFYDDEELQFLRNMTADKDGKIWLVTQNGFGAFENESLDELTPDNSELKLSWMDEILITSDDVVWINRFALGVQTYNQGIVSSILTTENALENLNIYPNPTQDYLQIDNDFNFKNTVDFEVFNVEGKRVMKGVLKANQLNVNDLNAGIYVLKIKQKGSVLIGKFEVYK